MPSKYTYFLILILLSAPLMAEEKVELETISIIGNRELPKIMNIVPWKKSQPGTFAGRPNHSLLDERPEPINREVFLREIDYYEASSP